MRRDHDGVDGAVKLTVAALRGVLGLLLVRLAEKVLPEDGAVVAEGDEVPTAPIRPPL